MRRTAVRPGRSDHGATLLRRTGPTVGGHPGLVRLAAGARGSTSRTSAPATGSSPTFRRGGQLSRPQPLLAGRGRAAVRPRDRDRRGGHVPGERSGGCPRDRRPRPSRRIRRRHLRGTAAPQRHGLRIRGHRRAADHRFGVGGADVRRRIPGVGAPRRQTRLREHARRHRGLAAQGRARWLAVGRGLPPRMVAGCGRGGRRSTDRRP